MTAPNLANPLGPQHHAQIQQLLNECAQIRQLCERCRRCGVDASVHDASAAALQQRLAAMKDEFFPSKRRS